MKIQIRVSYELEDKEIYHNLYELDANDEDAVLGQVAEIAQNDYQYRGWDRVIINIRKSTE